MEYGPFEEEDLNLPPTGVPAERRIAAAVGIACEYSRYPGEHHKDWTLDQILRALTGEDYDDVVQRATSGNPRRWRTGVAP